MYVARAWGGKSVLEMEANGTCPKEGLESNVYVMSGTSGAGALPLDLLS